MKNKVAWFAVSSAVAGSLLLSSAALAQSAPSVSIQSLSPGSTVLPGNEVTFSVVTSGFDGALTYSLSDSLSGSLSSSNINNSGVFTWIPSSSDAGTHNLTITVTDQAGNSVSATQQITVQGPASVSIQSLSPSASVAVGQPVFFTAAATNFTNPTYSVSDSFSNSSLSSSDINMSGGFSWTPLAQDVGTHSLTVYVSDAYGHSASANQVITVSPSSGISIQSLAPGTTVSVGTPLTFVATPSGFSSASYSLNDSFSGSSIQSGNINSAGSFSWIPTANDVGAHTITVYATDANGNTVNAATTITVTPAGSTTTTSTTSTLSPTQIQSVLSLLQVFGVDQSVVNNVAAILDGQTVVATAPAATNTYKFLNPLDVGSTGPDVTALQQRLTAEGVYSGPITGYYGPLTQAAVEKYQGEHGLDQLGNVGPGTRAALNQ